MKKVFISLITLILSFTGYSKTKDKEQDVIFNNYPNNLYLDSVSSSKRNHNKHFSHGSAHHYSAVNYANSVKINIIKEISKSEDELQVINRILSSGHMPSDDTKAKCKISQILYVDLLSINENYINKRCYMIKFISEYFGKSSHSHTYCTYYFEESGNTYYRTDPYVKYGKIDELEWATQILEQLK